MDKLPLELVGEILDIAIEESTNGQGSSQIQAYNLLHSIGLTCRTLYAVSHRKLYHHLTVGADTNRGSLLQKTLKSSPHLASSTRILSTSWACSRQLSPRPAGEAQPLSSNEQWIAGQAEGLAANWSMCSEVDSVEINISKGAVFAKSPDDYSSAVDFLSPFEAVKQVIIRTDRTRPSDVTYCGLPFDQLPSSLSALFPHATEVQILSSFIDLTLGRETPIDTTTICSQSVDNARQLADNVFKVQHISYHRHSVSAEVQQMIAPSWSSTRSLSFSDVCNSLDTMLTVMPNLTYLCVDANNFDTEGQATLFPTLASHACASTLEKLVVMQYTWSREDDWSYLFNSSSFPALRYFECQEPTSWLKGKSVISPSVDMCKLSKNRPGLRCRFKIEIRWQFRVSWAWFGLLDGLISEERVEWDALSLASEEKKRDDVALARQQLMGRETVKVESA